MLFNSSIEYVNLKETLGVLYYVFKKFFNSEFKDPLVGILTYFTFIFNKYFASWGKSFLKMALQRNSKKIIYILVILSISSRDNSFTLRPSEFPLHNNKTYN